MNTTIKRLLVALIGLIVLGSSLANAKNLNASISIERKSGTVHYEIKLDQPRNDQLILNAWKTENTGRRADAQVRFNQALDPSAPGTYRFSLPASDGSWRYYVRVGPGQAGYIGNGELLMPQSDGSINTGWSLWNSFEDTVPEFVQPVGYAVYFAIAAFALGGTAWVLSRLGRRQSLGA